MKIAFITNIIPQYRVTFYEKLCKYSEYQWQIFRGGKNIEDGRPDFKGSINIPQDIVENKQIQIGPYVVGWQKRAIGLVAGFNPDFIIVLGITGTLSNWLILLYAKLLKKKIIIWACGWEPPSKSSFALVFKHMLAKLYFSVSDYCLVYSNKAKSYLKSIGVESHKITICYNGIEIDHLITNEIDILSDAENLRSQENLNDHMIFLYVGGMSSDKKVDTLIEAFRQIQEKHQKTALWLVGDGPERYLFETLAKSYKLNNVTFYGRIFDGVDKYFAAADFFVLPGVGGLALNQAMFWNTPCIVGEADGTEEDLVFNRITGLKFKSGNVSSLADAMAECIEMNLEIKKEWSENGRKLIIERSNVSQMVITFIETIRSLSK